MADADRPARLNLGTVYRQTWPLIGRHVLALAVLAVAVGWAVNVGLARAPLPRVLSPHWSWIGWFVRLGTTLIYMFIQVLLTAGAAHVVLADRRTPAAALSDVALTALSCLPGLFLVSLALNCSSLLSWVALLILYGPLSPGGPRLESAPYIAGAGVIGLVVGLWALAWIGLASVTLIEERAGGVAALRQADDLACGQRWRLMAVYLPVAFVVQIPAIILPIMAVTHRSSLIGEFNTWGGSVLLDAISTVVVGALTAVAYRELSLMKDGDRSGAIAAIFD